MDMPTVRVVFHIHEIAKWSIVLANGKAGVGDHRAMGCLGSDDVQF